MYNLPYHKENDEQVIMEFIEQYPFAVLTGSDSENKPIVTQVPLFIEEENGRKILRGHIMKNTDHHKTFLHNENVLAVFTGKHTYVSGTWYSNPNTPSTWNYMSVHVKGIIRFVNESELEEILRSVSLHFEGQNQQSTTIFDNLPSEFKKRAIGLIAGFEIEIKEIDSVFKLSQDRDAESYHNIIRKLKEQNEDGRVIATEMEKRAKELFPGKVIISKEKSRMSETIEIKLRDANIDDLELLKYWDEQPHVIASDPDEDWNWEYELKRFPKWREQLIAEINGRAIGCIQIIDPAEEETHYWGNVSNNLKAIDIWIGEINDTGKGYGTEMMKLAIDRSFEDGETTDIIIDPLETNKGAIRFYERIGFKFIEKESNCLVYNLSRQDWKGKTE